MSIYFGPAEHEDPKKVPVPLVQVNSTLNYLENNHPSLLELLEKAGVSHTELIAWKTIVAPTEQAFADFRKELNDQLPSQQDLKQLLLYHCSPFWVVWRLYSNSSLEELQYQTANGQFWNISNNCVYDQLDKPSRVFKLVIPGAPPFEFPKEEPYVLVVDRVLRMSSRRDKAEPGSIHA